jgi:hypothetical protein
MGRAIQALGLIVMLGALVYGIQTDDLGTELLGATVGFALILIGRSVQTPRGGAG